jgi:uncharacterized protein YndB with AHSA1/START domain
VASYCITQRLYNPLAILTYDMNNRIGTVVIEGKYATLRYERRLHHLPEVVWKAITDPKQVSIWFSTTAKIDARPGGSLEYVSMPVGFLRTGRILVWNPPHIFEHEWHIDPHPQLPNGETESVIRWDLLEDTSHTILILTHSRLTKANGLRFAPAWHAFLDRLAAQLDDEKKLPDLMEGIAAIKGLYPAQ